ncbi:MAG: hypothetical protein WDO13_09590 [Verrucomicrobiota bacterium]
MAPPDLHSGLQVSVQVFLALAWAIALFGTSLAGRKKTPGWVDALQATFVFLLCVVTGVDVVAGRLTRAWPDLFPLAYFGLLVALSAPLWILTSSRPRWIPHRSIPLAVLYMVPFTFLIALNFKYSPDVPDLSRVWIIPIAIVVVFLIVMVILKKEQRMQALIAGGGVAGIVGWVAAIQWLATRIT